MMNTFKTVFQRLVPSRNIAIVLFIYIIATSDNFLIAQQDNNSIKASTSLMLQFFGPEALGIHVNHNTTRHISMNIGLGADLGVHIGANAYLTNREIKRFAWYGGLQIYLIREFQFSTGDIFGSMGVSSSTNKRETQVGVYLPIGFEYVTKKGFTIQLDVGPNLIGKDWGQTNTAPIMGSFKIGYTFRAKQ